MTYRELLCKAQRLINNNEITLGEYDEMTKPLDREIEQEPILDKIRAEVERKIVKRPWLDFKDRERDRNDAFLEVLDIIDKYKAEMESEQND